MSYRGANSLRAWRPLELQDPMVAFSIFTSVTITRGGTFTTVDEGLSFITRLLKGFMIGFAIASAVSLLILPITSRGNVFHDIKTYVTQIDAMLQAQVSFVKRSSTTAVWIGDHSLLHRTRTAQSAPEGNAKGQPKNESSLEAKKNLLQSSLTKLNGLQGKLQSDLFYSKDEFAWGKLSAGDLKEIGDLLRNVLLPLSGMAMLPDILDMIVENEGTRNNSFEKSEDRNGDEDTIKKSEMQKVVETLEERLIHCNDLMRVGLQYVLLVLELTKPKELEKQRKSQTGSTQASDEESKGDILDPLQQDFTAQFEQTLYRYYSRRRDLPNAMASLEAFSSADIYNGDESSETDPRMLAADPDVRQEFFLIVYMGHLQDNLLNAMFELIKFADRKVTDGTMKRNRLIFPKQTSIRDWLSLSSAKKSPKSNPDRRRSSHVDPLCVYQEHDAGRFPDPESLPPENFWERGSTILKFISHVIRSEQSIFGFRVAAASFCVGILAFLHQTQDFFVRQRCIWAMIVIVIGMSPTSGQSMFGFIARIAATVVSLALSLIVWYIVDGKTAGVIIFLYLANVFEVSWLYFITYNTTDSIRSTIFMSKYLNNSEQP